MTPPKKSPALPQGFYDFMDGLTASEDDPCDRLDAYLRSEGVTRMEGFTPAVRSAVLDFLFDHPCNVQDMVWAAIRTHQGAADGPIAEILQVLVDIGADPNLANPHIDHQQSPSCPLHTVARWGRPDWVDAFASVGANLDIQNEHGFTPAMTAIEGGHDEVVLRLGAHGSQLATQKTQGTDANLLHLACTYNRPGLIAYLAGMGLDVNHCDQAGDYPATLAHESRECLSLLASLGANLHVHDKFGCSPARLAAENSAIDAFQFLLSQGADVDELAKDGESIRDVAHFKPEVAHVLRAHEAAIAARCATEEAMGVRP